MANSISIEPGAHPMDGAVTPAAQPTGVFDPFSSSPIATDKVTVKEEDAETSEPGADADALEAIGIDPTLTGEALIAALMETRKPLEGASSEADEIAALRLEMREVLGGQQAQLKKGEIQAEINTLMDKLTEASSFGEDEDVAKLRKEIAAKQEELASAPTVVGSSGWPGNINEVVDRWKDTTAWYGTDVDKMSKLDKASKLLDPGKFATSAAYLAAIEKAVVGAPAGKAGRKPTPNRSSPGSASAPSTKDTGGFKPVTKMSDLPEDHRNALRETQQVTGDSDKKILESYNALYSANQSS